MSESSYDKVPYSNYCYPESHPRRMRASAVLLGLSPPPHESSRVLELGCGRGGNLIPMAEQHPDARFVGIDLSERQVQEAQQTTADLALPNVEFRHMSITDVTPDFGQFDYIICHGVFSWVPPSVRDHILKVCRDNLGPGGIALISYNTFPGWHLRGLARGLMNYHAKYGVPADEGPARGLEEAAKLLRLVAEAPNLQNRPISTLLKSEVERIKDKDAAYLQHEYLEEFNQPYYFHEFAEMAACAGLQYLADGRSNAFPAAHAGPDAIEFLERYAADPLRTEQYADFFRNQMFRRSYVCHAGPKTDWPGAAGRVAALYVTSAMRQRKEAKLAHRNQVQYVDPRGHGLVSGDPIVKVALAALEEAFPRAMAFEALCDHVLRAVRVPAGQAAAARSNLANQIAGFWMANRLELDVLPPAFCPIVTERPMASPVARLFAQHQELVPTRRHDMAALDDYGRRVIRLLDGRHSPGQMLDVLEAGQPDARRDAVQAQLSQALGVLADQALLVS